MRCFHQILALHILRTAQGTRTFLTTVGHPARLLPPRPGELCHASARPSHIHQSSRRHAPQGQRRGSGQGLLSAPIWTMQRTQTSSLCPLRRLLSSDGLVTQMVSSMPPLAINTACNRCNCQAPTQSNPDGEHVALCSTPQGTTIQNRSSTYGSAATCSETCAMRMDSSTNYPAPHQGRQVFSTVMEGMEECSR
jgi:hypothetical protein